MEKNRIILLIVIVCMTIGIEAQVRPPKSTQISTKQMVNAQKNYEAGVAYFNVGQYNKAFACFKEATNIEHAQAQYNLGVCYLEGKGTAQDYKKAVEWFEKAGEKGVKDAQYNLAEMYKARLGVPKDEKKAAYWTEKYYGGKINTPTANKPAKNSPTEVKIVNTKTGESIEKNSMPVNTKKEDTIIYDVADKSPSFPGGEPALVSWLMENLHYPKAAQEDGIQGKVLVSFVVANDGSVVLPEISKSVHPLLDAEAMRVVLSMPKWTPGIQKGKPVYVRSSFPVTFKLTGDVPEKESSEEAKSPNWSEDDYHDGVFELVEQNPSFPGGDAELMKWLQKNLRYPTIAMENGIQGRVMVQFVINKDGSIVEPSILHHVDMSLDAEALRVVLSMPKWTPGKQKGKAVRVRFTLPLTFRLQ